MTAISLRINGEAANADVEPRMHLADFLREEMLLTGTHIGCEHGVCGACTLMMDGRPVRSCLTFAASCDGADIRTIEGYGDDPLMSALRDAFSRRHALQCGYCTPGMLATAYDIVRRLPDADEARVREELAGNLCRCTGYAGIVVAIGDVLLQAPAALIVAHERATPLPASAVAPTRSADAAPEASIAVAGVIPSDLAGAVFLNRAFDLDLPASRAWALFQDLPAVVACLPGASLDEPEAVRPGAPFAGRMTVALGPMKVSFKGLAVVEYEDEQRRGRVRGQGGDGLTRSSAEGELVFTVAEAGEARSRIDVKLAYRLKGPLAQFGRPAIVADAVDRLAEQLARNLKATAEGRESEAARTLFGGAFLAQLMAGALRRMFRRTGR